MSFPTFFSRGVHNTLLFKNGGQFLYKGPWTSVFKETEIDRWFVGDFASATYTITVEVDSNKKEVLQVLVVGRPNEANCVVYGRVAIDDELVDVTATVNDSYVSVRLSTKIDAFNGAKAIYHVAYSGTINTPVPPISKSFIVPDTQPDPDPGSGSGSVGGSSIVLTSVNNHIVPSTTDTYNLGSTNSGWNNLYITDTVFFGTTPLSLTDGNLNLPQGTLIDGEDLNYFGRITVPGEFDVLPTQPNDVLVLRSGSNVTITTDPTTKEITINSSGGGGESTVSTVTSNSGPSFGVVAVQGQGSLIADREQDQLNLVAGANITLTTDAATDTVTISSTGGGGGGGGTASTIIVNPTTSGIYPVTMASGLSSISGNLLYGNSGVTIDVDTSTLNATALSARWADLAEKYSADAAYPPGMVLMFGGEYEVTQASGYENRKVAGVVSTNPAFIMNTEHNDKFVCDVALQGRVPCNVIGNIEKGDLLVTSDIPGVATSSADPKLGSVIGKALEDYNSDEEVGVIEVVVGRM